MSRQKAHGPVAGRWRQWATIRTGWRVWRSFGELADLREVRWVTEDGETHALQQSEATHPGRKLFGDNPGRVREATFIFGSGARVTVDFSEAT